jgi:hypothetical protein
MAFAANATAEMRTWTTADGKIHAEARLVDYAEGVAELEKTDKSTVKVRYERLSAADQQFLDAWKRGR